jgi:hypothetical protein
MKQRSPTLEGFRAMLLRPTFGLAEIAWRWSFGSAACLLLVFAFVEYLRTLPVSGGDLVLLRTGQPALIARAVAHIFRGSALHVIVAGAVLSLSLAIAWIVVASLARAATIKALVAYFGEGDATTPAVKERGTWRLRPLFGLNLFRAVATLTAVVGCLAAVLLARAATSAADPSPGSSVLIFLTVAILVWFVWSTLNWFLSLAAIFVVADGRDTFGAIAAAVDFCRTRAGAIFAAGTWFGLAHITVFVAAGFIFAFPLGFAAALPAGVVLGAVLLVTLLYLALSDFLYVGRLAAYVAILELPEAFSAPGASTRPPDSSQHSALSIQPRAGIDSDELILSDVPASS